MRNVFALLAILSLLLFVGCAALSSEQQAKLDSLEEKMQAAAAEAERIYNLQADVRQKWKDGKIDANEAIKLLLQLEEEGKRTAEIIAGLQADYKKTKEAGVHWGWIAYSAVSTIVNILLNGAVGTAVAGVEKGGNLATKNAIKDMGNFVLNWFVKRKTPTVSVNKS